MWEFEPRIPRISQTGKMIHEQLSRSTIGVAMEVLNELKPGLNEKLYARAMIIGLRRCGRLGKVQHAFPVRYCGEVIGSLIPDLIVHSKVVSIVSEAHIA
jgi:GxxExxY protein